MEYFFKPSKKIKCLLLLNIDVFFFCNILYFIFKYSYNFVCISIVWNYVPFIL